MIFAGIFLLLMLLPAARGVGDRAEGLVFEAESGVCHGGTVVRGDAGISWVEGFKDPETDSVSIPVTIGEEGFYDVTVVLASMGGHKENPLLLDGQNIGTLVADETAFTGSSLEHQWFGQGEHELSVGTSWGYIRVDAVQLTPSGELSDSLYRIPEKMAVGESTPEARRLYDWLRECYGKKIISGQFCDGGVYGLENQAVWRATGGSYPAILGLDMMEYSTSRVEKGGERDNAVPHAIEYWEKGGIVTFCWHWNAPDKYLKSGNDASGNPRWWQGFSTSNTDFDIAAVMNGKDPEGKALIDADIAAIAKLINKMGAAGIPILWRPLHEASGGWFWWGAKGAEPYKQFWKYLYDQFTNVYHCNNLIWVWNGQAADWYPGDEYVDVIGEDIYADAHSYGAQNAKFAELLEYPGTNKITALTENGVVFDIDNVVASNARWMWFGTWCGSFVTENGKYSSAYTEADIMRKTYQSEYVITLDELPDFS
jgi:mannan endo-1,4-beta-mannosidase